MQSMEKCYIGVDVAKETLEFSDENLRLSCANKVPQVRQVLQKLRQKAQGQTLWLACEATGVYHRCLASCAHEAKIPLCVLAPLRVKSFAGACGQLAKTDPLDAELIRKFAETYTPDETPYDKQRFDLQEVVNARKQLVKNRVALRQNLQTATTAVVVNALRLQCNALDRQIKMLEDEIRALLREKAKTDPRVEALAAEYSVGLVLLATLFAYFDEIGTLGRKRAASLSGTAPHPRDSGAFHDKRFIRGGRAVVRQALYVSSTALLLKGSPLRPVYDALRARGLTQLSSWP